MRDATLAGDGSAGRLEEASAVHEPGRARAGLDPAAQIAGAAGEAAEAYGSPGLGTR